MNKRRGKESRLLSRYAVSDLRLWQIFREIKFSALEPAFKIISSCSHSRNDSHSVEYIGLCNRLCFFKQVSSQPCVLRRALFFRTNRKGLSIHMDFTNQCRAI